MKKFKKLFLIIGIIAVLSVMFVVSVSASESYCEKVFHDDVGLEESELYYSNVGEYGEFRCAIIDLPEDVDELERNPLLAYTYYEYNNTVVTYFTEEFKEMFVDYILQNKDLLEEEYNTTIEYNAESFIDFIEKYYRPNNDSHYFLITDYSFFNTEDVIQDVLMPSGFVDYVDSEQYTVDGELNWEAYQEALHQAYLNFRNNNTNVSFMFDDYLACCYIDCYDSYIRLCGEEITNNELNTTITQKDTAITIKDTTISTLEGEKTKLESDVAGLNIQVADLVQDKAQLNASIKSLEKQLQIKIDKAYAEGLVDSEGGLTTSGIISIFAVVLTIGELIALVVFFVSKAKKRKHR